MKSLLAAIFVSVVGTVVATMLLEKKPSLIYSVKGPIVGDEGKAMIWVRNIGAGEAEDVRCTINVQGLSLVDVGPPWLGGSPQIGADSSVVPIPHLNPGDEVAIYIEGDRLSASRSVDAVVIFKGGHAKFASDYTPLPYYKRGHGFDQ